MQLRKKWLTICLVVLSLMLVVIPAAANDQQPLVNLFLFETDIREALSEISMQTAINIIPDITVSGSVTADLVDVPLEKALRIVLIGGGFTYRKIDDFYFVGLPDPRSTTFGELVETELIMLENTTATQIMAVLPSFLASYVRGELNGSILTVTAPPVELARIKTLVAQLDKPKKQVEVKVLITEISSEAIKDLGINLWEYTSNEGQTMNEEWEGFFGLNNNIFTLSTDIYGVLLSSLRLLESEQKAEIHANPRIIVSSGREADLFIGDRQILLVDSNDSPTTRVERIEVGVHLNVTPTIVGEDQIELKITPEMSHFVTEAQPDLIVKESSLSTTIRLTSGQTALLAGMTMQENVDYTKKVPILGDIPLLRWLFRNEVKRDSDKELLIFVTPVIQ